MRVIHRHLIAAVLAGALCTAPALAQPAPPRPGLSTPRVVEAADIGRYGGTFVTSTISDPRTFNPIASQE
ncbi:MAG: hypothetical protein QN125_08480, partial [Armatimonadota bacterium]|nr:hypothetical protein [Armatimonadota bacterium]